MNTYFCGGSPLKTIGEGINGVATSHQASACPNEQPVEFKDKEGWIQYFSLNIRINIFYYLGSSGMDFCNFDKSSRTEKLMRSLVEKSRAKRRSPLDEIPIVERKSRPWISDPNLADKTEVPTSSARASKGIASRDKTELKNRYNNKSAALFVVLISQKIQSEGLGGPQQRSIGNLHAMIIGKRLRNINMGIVGVKRKGRNLVEVSIPSYQLVNKLVSVQRKVLPSSWTAYIPGSRVSRAGVARDVEPSLSEEEVLEGVEWLSATHKVTRVERIVTTSRTGPTSESWFLPTQ